MSLAFVPFLCQVLHSHRASCLSNPHKTRFLRDKRLNAPVFRDLIYTQSRRKIHAHQSVEVISSACQRFCVKFYARFAPPQADSERS